VREDFLAGIDIAEAAASSKQWSYCSRHFGDEFETKLADRLTVVVTDGTSLAMAQINETRPRPQAGE
jgi:hypothetical protein